MSGAPARLKTIVLSPSAGVAPTATLIFAHGLGDTGSGWYDVAQMLSARPALRHMRFVLPNAPIQPVSLNFGQKMSSWFDILSLDDVSGSEDEEGLTKSSNAIKALVDAEIDGSADGLNGKGIKSDRVVVGGFSQGGAIALLSGLTKSPAVGGIIALSTWLPLRAKLVAPLFPEHATALPIFMAHGTADPVVKYSYGERSAKFIRAGDGGGAGLGLGSFRQGEDQRWRGIWMESYSGMVHSACPEEIEHMGQFLEKVVPAQ
ncbi:hypothetical protein CBS101457_002183 [Exobasidium rhododendri]|nr:hypothetical protein CBS101457_002183 [Exobasidium rhododendri]